MFKAFLVGLLERLWLSYKSTLLGVLVAAAAELLTYFATAGNVPPYVHVIVGVALTPFLAWKDKAVANGTIKLLVAFLVLAPVAAHAQATTPPVVKSETAPASVKQVLPEVAPSDDPAPTPSKFGGCIGPWTCFQPSAVVVPLSINLRSKTVEPGFQPGIGYGVTFHQGQWYSFGVDVYFNVNVAPQTAAIAVLGKAVNGYLRFGWSKGFIGDSNATAPRLLFGVGTDL